MSDTINIHAQFSGVVAQTIDEIIKSGLAATRTEAIRLALIDYKNHHFPIKRIDTDESVYRSLGQRSLAKELNNPKDTEAAKWYIEQYKKGAYDELNKS